MDPVTIALAGGAVAAYSDSGAQTWLALSGGMADIGGAPVAAIQFPWTMKVTLDNVLQYGDFASLFDQYRVDKCDFQIELQCGPSYNGGAGSMLPTLYCRYDPNDSTAPSTFESVAVSGNCKQLRFADGACQHLVCVPRPAQPMYVAGVASGYAQPASTKQLWIDTTNPSPSVEHYAYKIWARNFVGAANSGLSVRITPMVYLSFRRTR